MKPLEDIPHAEGQWRQDRSFRSLYTWDVPDDGFGWATEHDVECPSCFELLTLGIPIDELMRPCPICGECMFSFEYDKD